MHASEAFLKTHNNQKLKIASLKDQMSENSFYKFCHEKIQEAVDKGEWSISLLIDPNPSQSEVLNFLSCHEGYYIINHETRSEFSEGDNFVTKIFNRLKTTKNISEP